MADPGAKRRKKSIEKPFTKAIRKFKAHAFPKRFRPLIKPLLKNSFSTISKALGHERAQFTLVGVFSGLTIAANVSRADPGANGRKKCLINVLLFIFLFLFLPLSLSLSLFLFLFLLLLPLPLLIPLPLPVVSSSSSSSSSSSLSLSFSVSLSLSPFLSLSLILHWMKKLKVEQVTQSACWTPLTTRYYKYYKHYKLTSSSAKQRFN